ncbi:MAG: hypothetical protein ABRQ39_17045 [Candidatus Eremiobacterota bacterium]
MPRTKTKEKEDKILRISYENHKRLKLLATIRDMEIRELTNQIIRDYLDKYEKKNKISILDILKNAPYDEEPLSEDEIKESEASLKEYLEGKGRYLTDNE